MTHLRLLTERELADIEARLDDIEDMPLRGELFQLRQDANTLVEQVHELWVRWSRGDRPT